MTPWWRRQTQPHWRLGCWFGWHLRFKTGTPDRHFCGACYRLVR